MSLRVLLVDMNEDVSDVFTMLFENCGYTVTTVQCGTEAVASVQASPPDAIFTSIRIGDMSGFELCTKLRQLPQSRDCIIVALTGGGAEGTEETAKAAGFDHYFIKPVNLEDMLRALKPLERRTIH